MCLHEETESFDHPIWFEIEEQDDDNYWIEFEAAFVHVDTSYVKYGCLDCGERKRALNEERTDVRWTAQFAENELAEFKEEHQPVYHKDWHESVDW